MTANIIQAFTEGQTSRLTGISPAQLRAWDAARFYMPEFAHDDRRESFSRVYSFRDLVALRVLNDLRNVHRVSLRHLKDVSNNLNHLGKDKWTSAVLYVLNRRVVVDAGDGKQDVVSGQGVFDIPLKVVASDMRKAVTDDQRRTEADLGQITKHRFVISNSPVFSGTRLPVATVVEYLDAGYSSVDILREFPFLTEKDIVAAQAYKAAGEAA